MNIEKANKAIKAAWIVGIISGIVTLIATLTGWLGFNIEYLGDVALISVLTIGIFRKSRTAAVVMFIYFIASKIILWTDKSNLSGGGVFGAIIFGYFFFQGIRGTFAYWKITNSNNGINSLKLSKGFYISSFWFSVTLGIVSLFIGLIYISETDSSENGFGFIGAAFILAIYGVVNSCSVYCKMWNTIQDGHARTSPKKAIGFLFIPFFNIYWLVPAFCGLARDYNGFIRRHSIPSKAITEWPFVLFVISILMVLASSIGFVIPSMMSISVFIALIGVVVFLITNTVLITIACNSVNAVRTSLRVRPNNYHTIDENPDFFIGVEAGNQQIVNNQDEISVDKIEVCENCRRTIGKLEQACAFKNHIVCQQCHEKLKKQEI